MTFAELHYHGTPCRRAGHTLRYSSGGSCVECGREDHHRKQRTDPEYALRKNAYSKNRYHNEPGYAERILAHQRERYRSEPGYAERQRAYQRDWALKQKYGLSGDEYEIWSELQDSQCAICGGDETPPRTRLAVDHDHETGEIRGLLCNSCNVSIGRMGDDPERLRSAAEYLEAA